MGVKPCGRCGQTKPLGDFHRRKASKKDGHAATCKPCHAEYVVQLRSEGKMKKVPAARTRGYRLKARYGLTVEQANELLSGGCEICGTHDDLVIDHCHASGRVRGALCRTHNLALGHAKDDVEALLKLALYVEKHRG